MKKITFSILALMIVMVIALGFTSCSKPEEVKAAEPVTEVVATDTANYAEVKKVAQSLTKEDILLNTQQSEAYCSTLFDTKTGVVYFSNGKGVVYQKDGLTPRNIYHENGVWTDTEKVEYLLNTYWDTLVDRLFLTK